MPFVRRCFVAIAVSVSLLAASAGLSGASVTRGVADLGRAGERAARDPHELVEYDVFGDSISAGYGVPAHLTWVAAVSYHLFATQPSNIEHRFYNHSIEGQAIATPSGLATDRANSSLVAHLQNFLQNPSRTTPIDERRFVITPSVNELIVSDQGTSGRARVDKAIAGIWTARQLLRDAGVLAADIVVLPMPPIGQQFAAEFDSASEIDQTLASMIVDVNAGLASLLSVAGYPSLDGNNDGLAGAQFFDDLSDAASGRGPDGLHLDVDGHRSLAADIDDFFRG